MKRFVWLAALLLVVLTACVPVQQAVQDVVTEVGRGEDGAVLVLTHNAVAFDPVAGVALNVALFVGGEDLSAPPEGCWAVVDGWGCVLGDVSELVSFPVSGRRLSASVSYFRAVEGESLPRAHFFYVRQ